MAWSVLQSASAAGSGVSSQAVTCTSNVGSGTKLICYIGSSGGGSVSITSVEDGAGNSFNVKASVSILSGYEVQQWLYAIDTPAGDVGTKPTITVQFSGGNNASVLIQEVSGLAAETTSLDGTAGTSSGSGATPSSPTYSSTAASEFLISMMSVGGGVTFTGPSGYTTDANSINTSGGTDLGVAYKNSTGGSESASWSWPSSGQTWTEIMVAFKLGASGVAPAYVPQVVPPGRQSPAAWALLQPPYAAGAPGTTAAAGLATGTGTAQPPAPAVTAFDVNGPASGTGTAFNPTVSTSGNVTANAGLATGTGAAQGPSVAIAVPAGLATGTGTAQQPVATVIADAGLAAGTGTAQSPGPVVIVNAGLASGTGAALQPSVSTGPVLVVNQWANSVGQGTTFTSITSSLQSCVLQLDSTYSVGGGSGTPSSGSWLFAIASWTQDPALAEVHVGINDDGRDFWRQYPASGISGNTRTAIAYTCNIGSPSVPLPSYVYCAPDGQVAALTLLVVEVSGLGPWDTVGTGYPASNYAAAATSLSLSGGAPGAASFFIAGVGGDSTAASQAFAPSGWTTLHAVSQSDGSDQLASNYLTSAYLASSSSSQSVSASASTTDLSGMMLAVYITGTDPIPASQNPNWPYLKFEAAFGSGFNTPVSEMTWTDLTTRLWDWDEDSTGIQFQLGQLQATSGTVTLDNFDNALCSTNSSSPYYPDVQPGTPVRIRAALGTIGGVAVNRWYVIMRVTGEWTEKIGEDYRRYAEVSLTDLWTALSATPPTFYRSEIYADSPYAWWPCDDQPGTAGVLPTALLNAAPGNTNTLNVVLSPNGGTAQSHYDEDGNNTNTSTTGPASGYPPGIAIYTVGANAGWMFGDPQSAPSSIAASGNPEQSTPGSASWQASGQAGSTGSYGWFLSCNDSSFPPLSGGVTIECWFNAAFYGSADVWCIAGNIGSPPPVSYYAITGQPYNSQITIWEIATGSHPVCLLYLDASGHLILETFNGSSGTAHSIYTASDLRSNSWHMVTVELTATTWQVWLDGGANANAPGTATGMTPAWTWMILAGDLGSDGGSSAGTGLVHGGNMSLAHVAVYPVQLPYYRVLDHYWAAVSAFGQLPAPQSVQITWMEEPVLTAGDTSIISDADGPDGTPGGASGGAVNGYSYSAGSGVSVSAVVSATAGSVTSGPSAWAAGATNYTSGSISSQIHAVALWISWTGLAPSFNLYTAANLGAETEAAVVNGSGDSFKSGYGSGASGAGVCQTAGGSGASPPAAASSVGDTVGQRIERLMHGGKTSSPSRCIDSTATQLVQAPGSDGGGLQASAAIQQIQQSDSGLLYVDSQNNLVYWSRPHLAAQYSSPVWTLTPDAPPAPGAPATAIPYWKEDLGWVTDPQRIFNVITIAPISPTGAALPEYTPTDASGVESSQETYGAQPLAISSWLQSTSEMQSQANWIFSNWGVPRRRIENAKVDAASHPAAWPLVLGISVGDVTTAQDWQIGGGGSTYTYRVTQLKRHIEFGGVGGREAIGAVWPLLDWEPSSYWT